jgi:transcriptional repressor NrdR
MKCPYCQKEKDRVVDSRASQEGYAIRRRRQCLECSRRFTTYEKIEESPVRVVKKDGAREPFDRDKIRRGLEQALYKRPVHTNAIEQIVSQAEAAVYDHFDREVMSSFIGELVMSRLRDLDEVAYIRFASVYREFKDVGEFVKELRPMLGDDPVES